jgi:peroxiredoxin
LLQTWTIGDCLNNLQIIIIHLTYAIIKLMYQLQKFAGSLFSLLLITLLCTSCNKKSGHGDPVYQAETLLKNEEMLMNYLSTVAFLSEPFVAYNDEDDEISKKDFLMALQSGHYIPLKLKSNDHNQYYRLHKVIHFPSVYTKGYVIYQGKQYLKYYLMEGKTIPDFKFTDLNGKTYTPESTKGKILVFKFWFLGCVSCIAEMPEDNKIVKKYKDRKDILFISLAFDDPAKLRDFLKTTKFDYLTAGNLEDYISNKLQINVFSSHMILDKKGKIVKVTVNYREIDKALSKL